jgi:hypothetical protein
MGKSEKFVFRKHANIGYADAVEDRDFLINTFVDNGELELLTNKKKPECIVVGRTGAGKTALLEKIKESNSRVIQLAPEGLALNFLSNDTALGFYTAAGVNMDLFYRLLWRHIFSIELIRNHFQIENEAARDSFIEKLKDKFKNNLARKQAIDYLTEWGGSFWQESEYRVKEITKTFEKDMNTAVEANFGTKIPGFDAGAHLTAEMANNLTEEQKAEIVQIGQSVVNKVQIKVLSDIMDVINKVIDDPQKLYFITIDRLDETWVSEELRYHLIRALIETVRDFNNKIVNVKIIIALRLDLLDRVFRYTRQAGYQEEKYLSLHLSLTWTKEALEDLVNRRVKKLVKEHYTKKEVALRDLLPPKIGNANSVKYFFDRTLGAPRDAILFFNKCIEAAEGKPKLNQTTIRKAEVNYSRDRMRALADEWSADYSNLIELAFFIRGFPSIFIPVNEAKQIEQRIMEFLVASREQDYIYRLAYEKFNSGEIEDFIREAIRLLFKVGVVGIRRERTDEFLWAYSNFKLTNADIRLSEKVKIHPAFYSALEIKWE